MKTRLTIPHAVALCEEDVSAALAACEARGHKVKRAFQSGTGIRFELEGVKPDVGVFGLKRLVEGWKRG